MPVDPSPRVMSLAIIESPYRGDLKRNILYLQRLIRHVVLDLGYSPYASHQMLTMALQDSLAAERRVGIIAGYAWAHKADIAIFGLDYGISPGMRAARDYYEIIGLPCMDLTIGVNEDAEQDTEASPHHGRSGP